MWIAYFQERNNFHYRELWCCGCKCHKNCTFRQQGENFWQLAVVLTKSNSPSEKNNSLQLDACNNTYHWVIQCASSMISAMKFLWYTVESSVLLHWALLSNDSRLIYTSWYLPSLTPCRASRSCCSSLTNLAVINYLGFKLLSLFHHQRCQRRDNNGDWMCFVATGVLSTKNIKHHRKEREQYNFPWPVSMATSMSFPSTIFWLLVSAVPSE